MKRRITVSRYATLPPVEDMVLTGLEYLWALFVILNGNSVYHANRIKNYHLLELCIAMTAILLGANFLLGRIKIGRRNGVLSVCMLLYALVYFAVRRSTLSREYFIGLFLLGLPLLYLLFAEFHRMGRLMKLLNRMVNVVVTLCVISLICWLLGPILGILKPNMSTRIAWGNYDVVKGIYGVFFQIQRENTFGIQIYRNSGIFTEAPMLNLWSNLSLAINLLLNKKPSTFKTVVLVATVISTFSTTGLIFIVLCFGLKYYDRFRKISRRAKAFLLGASVVVIPVVIYFVFELLNTKSETLSYAMRMSDYIGGIMLWLDYPVFGSGFGILSPLLKYMYNPNGATGFSNSVMAVLATGGLWMAVVYYVPHVLAIFPAVTKSKEFSGFGICFLYLFVTTIFFARYLAVVMIALDLAILLEREFNDTIG